MPPVINQKPSLCTQVFAITGRMDWFRGLRAATALCAPRVLGDLAGIPNLGRVGLGGFEAIIAHTVSMAECQPGIEQLRSTRLVNSTSHS